MNYRHIIIFMLFSILTWNPFIYGNNGELDSLETFVNQALEEWDIPGIAVLVIKDDSVLIKKGFGVSDLETQKPISPQTLFSLASGSKPFTATLAAMLQDEGIIDVNAPIQDYFPEFSVDDPLISSNITFKDLLTHRSGLGRYEFYRVNVPENRYDIVKDMKYFELTSEFRNRFSYSNLAYTVAGCLLAKKAEYDNWESLIREKLFSPLGMNNTVLELESRLKSTDRATPYIDWGEGLEKMEYHNSDILGPAGGIITNLGDMEQWLRFQLNSGKVGENEVMNAKSLALMRMPIVPIPRPISDPGKFYASYGFGWFVESYREHVHIHHGGVLFGFTSLTSFLPDDNIGIVILSNKNNTRFVYALEGYIYDRLLGKEPIDWNSRYLEQKKRMEEYYKKMAESEVETRNPDTEPSHALENYAGTYSAPGYGEIKITLEDEVLTAHFTTIDIPLIHFHYDVFECSHPVKHVDWKFNFRTDDEGSISSFAVIPGYGMKELEFVKAE